MLERLATAGAGGESLANEVDQLRSQVREFFFFFFVTLFHFFNAQLFVCVFCLCSPREARLFPMRACRKGPAWAALGGKGETEHVKRPLLLALFLHLRRQFFFLFFSIDSTSPSTPPNSRSHSLSLSTPSPPQKKNTSTPHTHRFQLAAARADLEAARQRDSELSAYWQELREYEDDIRRKLDEGEAAWAAQRREWGAALSAAERARVAKRCPGSDRLPSCSSR